MLKESGNGLANIEPERSVRVHLIHFYSSPGGIEILSSRVIRAFSDVSFRVFTVRPPVPGAVNVYQDLGVPVVSGSRSNLRAFFRLLTYARRNRKDLFHLMNTGPYYLLAVRFAGVAGIVYSIRGTKYWKGFFQKWLRKLAWWFAIGSRVRLISNSEYSRKVFLEKINARADIRVVYNPVSAPGFIPRLARGKPDVMKIIYVGRLNRGKNLEEWIKVAGYVHSRMPDTIFEIYGSGPLEEELKIQIAGMSAESYILLRGFRHDIENVYREADLLLFLSEYESFGNVVVESILCGTPVVVADIPAMCEIFREFPVFLLSGDGDLGIQVIDKLNNYDRLSLALKKAMESFKTRFSMEMHTDSLRGIYHSFYEK